MLIVLAILAVMWSVGVVGGAVSMAVSMFRDGEWGVGLFVILAGTPITLLLAAVPWGAYYDSQSPDLATLKKTDWECAASHQERRLVGKVMTTVTVCDAYTRREDGAR